MDLTSGEWGRIGSSGRVVIEPFTDEREAMKAGVKIEAAKRRWGLPKSGEPPPTMTVSRPMR
jgi:predicted DNA-binding WGR domain protein